MSVLSFVKNDPKIDQAVDNLIDQNRFEDAKIKLWSIQTVAAYESLLKKKRLCGDARRADKMFRPAYRWMVDRMREHGIPMNRKTPIWAWYRYDENHRMPDLRRGAHLYPGTKGVRLHLNAPRRLVLLSDFNDWHDVLNDWPTTYTEAEWDRFEKMNPNSKQYRQAKMESWEKIIENNNGVQNRDSYFTADTSIQAVLPYLDLSWITKIDYFIAR